MKDSVKFTEFLPDQPVVGNNGCTDSKNVLPHGRGYRSMPSLLTYSGALTARCQGAISAQASDSVVHDYCGDATNLYELSDTTWTDISGATYGTASDVNWSWVVFGDFAIASNWTNNIQYIDMATGSAFADLTTTLRCKYLASAKNFVVAGYTYDSSDGTIPHRIRWSALNDASDWTASQTTQSDWQDLPSENGPVSGIVGGDTITVLQDRAVTIGRYVGTPSIWSFSQVSTNLGCSVPGSIIAAGDDVYFLGADDFYVVKGGKPQPIGAQKIDSWFYKRYNDSFPERVTSSIDPAHHMVAWSFPSKNSSTGTPDTILFYHWLLNQWAYAEMDHEMIYFSLSKGYTLEGLDALSSSIDDLTVSLDSRAYVGGNLLLSAFTAAHELAFFTGDALEATIDYGAFQPIPGSTSLIKRARPVVEGSSAVITVQHGKLDTQTETTTWSDAVSPTSTGNCGIRKKARYHQLRMNITGGFNFAQGFDVEFEKRGHR